MKTKKALAGLLGLLGSLPAAAPLLAFVGFLFTDSLSTPPKQGYYYPDRGGAN